MGDRITRLSRQLLLAIGAASLCVAAGCGGEGATGPGTIGTAPPSFGCQASCSFKDCGDDGCGGSCGACGEGLVCQNYACTAPGCEPFCDGAECGDDGCGGQCGFCEAGSACDAGVCVAGGDPTNPVGDGHDDDADGYGADVDNCPTVYNPNQSDLDGDWVGDVCDPDMDNDGYINDLDCSPADPQVSPGMSEWCFDDVDNDCDGLTDEDGAADCTPYYVDGDGDGAGQSDTMVCMCEPDDVHDATVAGDCDDAVSSLSPLKAERCDGIDNNCNLLVDEGCDDDGDGYCDWDMDIYGTPAVCPMGGGDCQDYFILVHPGMAEIPDDGLDNDCDGVTYEPSTQGTIVPNCSGPCVGISVDAFMCAMELCYPGYQQNPYFSSPTGDDVNSTHNAISHYGDASNDLDPFWGTSYAIMGTGNVNNTISHQDQVLPLWASMFDPVDPVDEIFDVVEFSIRLTAPAGVTGFSIDYIFMSAEYHEWVGSQFNDRFYIKLRAPVTTSNQWEVINYASCSNPTSYWDKIIDGQKVCYITINAAFAEPCPGAPTNISGTGHECSADGSSTGWLTTTWPIQEGEIFDLTFHIHDTGDENYDSQVVIDNFRWEGGSIVAGTDSHN